MASPRAIQYDDNYGDKYKLTDSVSLFAWLHDSFLHYRVLNLKFNLQGLNVTATVAVWFFVSLGGCQGCEAIAFMYFYFIRSLSDHIQTYIYRLLWSSPQPSCAPDRKKTCVKDPQEVERDKYWASLHHGNMQ
jgi:hypothetical protein